MYAVVGTAPTVDVTVGTGPFRSLAKAAEAEEELTAKGYNTETVELFPVSEIDSLTDWGNDPKG